MINFNLNLKNRIRNLYWWFALVAIILQIGLYFNLDLTKYIGQDWKSLGYLLATLLTLMGITVDTSTKGFSDTIPETTNEPEQETQQVVETADITDVVKLQKIKDLLNS
jgi:uncharacterized membrane protein